MKSAKGILIIAVLVGLASVLAAPAAAQSPVSQTGDGAWAAPVNLSRSGAASEPAAVVDSDGRYHVVWQDAFDGFVYTSGDGEEWSNPSPLEFPFGTRRYFEALREEEPTPLFPPTLLAGPNGRIHAFWQDTTEDELILYASNAPQETFSTYEQWSPRQLLSISAITFDTALGADGQLYLVYLQTSHSAGAPAGIYFRRWLTNALIWSDPELLYESVYFRLLEPGDAEALVAAGPEGRLVVAWDDLRSQSILAVQSPDEGETWSDVAPLAALDPLTESSAGDGQDLALVGLATDLLGQIQLLWQAPADENCVLNQQAIAPDAVAQGATQTVAAIPCGQQLMVISDASNALLLADIRETGSTLQAWDGAVWSEPLTFPTWFEDPDTNQDVILGCIQPLRAPAGALSIVGCDDNGGGEIWLLPQAAGLDPEQIFVFPTPGASLTWDAPVQFTPSGQIELRAVTLAADSQGQFHLVWSQTNTEDSSGVGRTLIHALWDPAQPEATLRPVTLFSMTDETAEQPALATDAGGRLYLLWNAGAGGELTFSHVSADLAAYPINWTTPRTLPTDSHFASSSVIAVSPQGILYVAYAVPLNEERGIYCIRSEDQGATWTDPMLIAGGAETGWAMVDNPTLAIGRGGVVHAAWSSLPLPGSTLPAGIHYARSDDGGEQWSEPLTVASGAVAWPQLALAGDLEVHLIWQETANQEIIRHWWSTSGGLDWFEGNPVPGLENAAGPVRIAVDSAGRGQLVALTDETVNATTVRLGIQQRFWDGEFWQSAAGGPTSVLSTGDLLPAAFAIAPDGQAALLVAGKAWSQTDEGQTIQAERIALFSHQVDLPAVTPTPLPTLTPTATPEPEPTATVTPLPSATPDLTTGGSAGLQLGPLTLGSEWAGLMLGAIPAGLIVIVALIAGIVIVRRNQR